ncbi:hypothetical protein MOK15_07630 [Sphingobium sp. BYY-5]|uniref:hypothetical protein n=1 Tax=Sphingobium sp. BYY-5 TaxID=2926400 RepID=UPI001FA6DACB|nr:hypothetical protein [Sphingobium sp. BYY-5]MCI4589961.1 hypothetical protein [Sphingobium sp. BYY-5]
MYSSRSTSFRGASRAILSAGPVFVAATMAAWLYLQLPAPVPVEAGMLIAVPLIMLFALIFGPFVACVPILLGTVMMDWLSSRCWPCAPRITWLAVGVAIGTGLAILLGATKDSPEIAFALTVTCGLSAWLSHSRSAG